MLHQMLSSLAGLVSHIITTFGYPGIVFVMVAENVFPPIPSEAVLPFAGFLVSDGAFTLIGVTVAGMIGSVLGALALYAFGYYGDEVLVRRFLRRWGKWFLLSEEDLDKSVTWFKHYGKPAVFTARMIPLIRSLISIPAGLSKMPLPTFIFFTSVGTAIWSFILTYAGFILGENWERVGKYLEKYEKLVVVAVLLSSILYLYKRIASKRSSESD